MSVTLVDEDIDHLAGMVASHRIPWILLWLYTQGVLDDDAYAQAVALALTDADDGGGAVC